LTYWELATADQGQAQAAWSYVGAMQGALANIWDAGGMKRVLDGTQRIIERLAGTETENDGPDDLTALRKVLAKCPAAPAVR
jgi:hypothetical protein